MKSDEFYKQNTLPDLHETNADFVPLEIGPYKVEGLLSKGGMSYLYLATHPDIAYPVAIKVLSPKYFKNKEIAELFLKEAEIIKTAKHPNIVHLYGHGEWEKGLYIAMEFVRGVSLRQFIQQHSLQLKRSLEIIIQVAYALSHLHLHKVVHRDLKPENILITEDGSVKVIDFGVAHLMTQEEKQGSPRTVGTPVYMSPEQKENPSQVTERSDIYSLAVVAYELVHGKLRQGGINVQLLPTALSKILGKALAADPEERYQTMVEFITDLSQYVSSLDEEKGEKTPSEILHMLAHTNALLLPEKAPKWNQLDIGLCVQGTESFSGLYLDFFQPAEGKYCIFLAEPIEIGASALIHSMNLRGMARMAIGQKKDAVTILKALNQSIYTDPIAKQFSFCLILLDAEKEQLCYASSMTSLIHIQEGNEPKEHSTLSAPLGASLNFEPLETVDNWQTSDTLVLRTKGSSAIEPLLSPSALAEYLMKEVSTSAVALVIQKLY